MRKRKSYTREFKLEAVRLLEQGDRPAADVARELGIKRNQLYKWKEQLSGKGEAAFPGQGRPAGDNGEGQVLQSNIRSAAWCCFARPDPISRRRA